MRVPALGELNERTLLIKWEAVNEMKTGEALGPDVFL